MGQKETVIFCDRLKTLGFKHALVVFFGKDDLIIPNSKINLINDTKKKIEDYENNTQTINNTW